MKQPWIVLNILLSLLFISCDVFFPVDAATARTRVVVSSEGNDLGTLQAWIEGVDGNSVNGALVYAINSANVLIPLQYDAESLSYVAQAPLAVSEVLTFKFNSLALDGERSQTILHNRLGTKPLVTLFRDADANSVLSGQTLSKDKDIQIAWNSLGEGVVYQISIRTALQEVFFASSESPQLTIPANSLNAGVWYLNIAAQRIFGDPLFNTADYYSVSCIKSSSLAFTTQ